jgi:ribonuclease HI
VTSYDETTEEYTMQMRVGGVRGWTSMTLSERRRALKVAEGTLLERGTEATEGWEQEQPLLTEHGWWVRFTGMDKQGRRVRCEVLGEGESGRQEVEWGALDRAIEGLGKGPPTRETRLKEKWLGRSRFSSSLEMHPAIQDFWQHDADIDPPEGVRERLRRHTLERASMAKRRRRNQSTITGIPMSEPGVTMLPGEKQEQGVVEGAVECTLVMGQEIDVERCANGRWELGRGRAVWRPESGPPIRAELAKVRLWRMRERTTWEAMSLRIEKEARSAEQAEDRGHRTPAWQLTAQIRRALGLTQLVGTTTLTADVHFPTWTSGFDASASLQDSLILLDALPGPLREGVVDRLREGGDWAVLANITLLDGGVIDALDSRGNRQIVLPMERVGERKVIHAKMYEKGWWRSGSKKIVRATGEMHLWVGRQREEVALREVAQTPIIEGASGGGHGRQVEFYLDSLPSGPYRGCKGTVVWTDGSKRTVRGVKRVGAGIYCPTDEEGMSQFEVGGGTDTLRGEMAAIARAIVAANQREERRDLGQDLTILTDSLTTMQAIQRWTRHDFAPVNEGHWDILRDLLGGLRKRRGKTTVAWVKAHAGDVGNEMADGKAWAGCEAGNVEWSKEVQPLGLHDLRSGDQVSEHGWDGAAQKHALEVYGEYTRERLRAPGQVQSTESLVRSDRGREYLGYALTAKDTGLTEADRRAMMQARSGCYPTRSHVARFKGSHGTGVMCELCGRAVETFGHLQTGCCKLTDAHRTAHNMVAEAILGAIHEKCPHLEIEKETTLGDWLGPGAAPGGIAGFKPDAFIRDSKQKRIVVWEFTRGMSEDEEGIRRREEAKRQAYHGVVVHLKHAFPDHQVEFQPVVVGILTSIRQQVLEEQLEWLGMKQGDKEGVGRAAAIAGVRANGYVLRQWREKKEHTHGGGQGVG